MSSAERPRNAWFWLAIAEWFCAGRLPHAPGTFGSLAAVPFALLLLQASPLVYWMVALGLTAIGVLASQKASEILAEKDPQSVVIDEVVGVILAFGFLIHAPAWTLILSFGAFRFLDIKKPGPIFQLQSLKPNGIGIMADDVAAGLLAGTFVRGLWELSRCT